LFNSFCILIEDAKKQIIYELIFCNEILSDDKNYQMYNPDNYRERRKKSEIVAAIIGA